MTAVEANPVFAGRIVDHGPTWKWFQFDMLRMELRAGDRLRVSCAQISPLRFGEILVIGVIDNLVYLSGSAFDGIAAIADLDYVYLVGRAEAQPAAGAFSIDPDPPDIAARQAARAMDAAKQRAEIQAMQRAPVPTLSARLGHLKHGPAGSGLSGPCDADCRKCAAERIMATDAARLKMASEMTIDPEAIRKAFNLPPAPAPKPVDPLDVEYDGKKLRTLLTARRGAAQDRMTPLARNMTTAQRAAVSAHWSAELRAKVAASKERERNVVRVDLDDDAC